MEDNFYIKTDITIDDVRNTAGLVVYLANNYYIEDIYGNRAMLIVDQYNNNRVVELEFNFREYRDYIIYQLVSRYDLQYIGYPQCRQIDDMSEELGRPLDEKEVDMIYEKTTKKFVRDIQESGIIPEWKDDTFQSELKILMKRLNIEIK